MRYLFLIQIFISVSVYAQHSKPAIDTSDLNRWPYITGNMMVSNDGNYVLYSVKNNPVGGTSLFVKNLKSSWELELLNIDYANFTKDSHFVIFQRNDSVCILSLVTKLNNWIGKILSYKLFEQNGLEYLIYSNKGKQNLVTRNIISCKEQELLNVKEFSFYDNENTIFLTTQSIKSGQIKQCLNKLTIDDWQLLPLWSTYDSNVEIRINTIAYDSRTGQISFATHSGRGNAIWYYSKESNQAILLANDSISKLDDELKIGDICKPGFSHDSQRLFVTLDAKIDTIPLARAVSVDIWNYKDLEPKSQQLFELQHPEPTSYFATLSLATRAMIRLNRKSETVDLFKGAFDTLACITRWEGGSARETNWNPESRRTILLVNTKTGQKRKINFSNAGISPRGKYVVGDDMNHQTIYLYSVLSDSVFNVTNCFPPSVRLNEDFDFPGPKESGLQIADWISNDSALIVYDKYDVWMVDPIHQKAATCLTKGYGRGHHIILRLINRNDRHTALKRNVTYVLSAFNERSKESGFVSLRIGESDPVKPLTIGPYIYEGPYNSNLDSMRVEIDGKTPFLIRRESAGQSPNLFITKDFVRFSQISSVHPEDNYNWLSSEVVSWMCDSKTKLSGVLYKPLDFDPKKKYPMLITYYEQMSHRAFEFKRPEYATDNINIPWFVSRGYLVFTPDIRYRIGHPGQSACESIVSGTKSLLKFSWVDGTRIAIEGHSWGGFQTNYLVTHSDLFCAALSASAVSDFISSYGSLTKNGYGRQYIYETSQSRIGGTPWERLDLYIENSPVLRADRVHTPILLMSNKGDAAVPFAQGIEFFTALRRLKKKSWLLQYDGEGHSLSSGAAVDYTIRITQFFDHYCKDRPAPKWMTEGVPAKLKGIDSGLDESRGEP